MEPYRISDMIVHSKQNRWLLTEVWQGIDKIVG